MDGSDVYRIVDNVHVREEDFGLLVISRTTPALALNSDLKSIWNLIDGVRTVDDVNHAISEEFGEENTTYRVNDVFQKLATLELIEKVER